MTKALGRKLIAGLVFTVLAASSGAAAQEMEVSDEDKARLAALMAFLDTLGERLPTMDRIDPQTLPVTFPFREVQEHVVVDVAFGDDDRRAFMFDTGAPTLITEEIGEAHAGAVLIEQIAAAGGGKLLWYPVVEVPSITVGGSVVIDNATAEIGWASEGAFYCITRDGLFGASTMRSAIWQVDYGAQEITVAATIDQLDHIDGAIALPFTHKEPTLSPSPIVELGVGDGTLTFIVDTGGGIPLTINSADFAALGLEVPENAPTVASLAAGAGGAFESTVSGVTLPVRFGDTELTTTVVVGDGMAPTTQGNMGHSFLKNFVVTFDWSTRTMYLDPLSDDGSVPPLGDAGSAGMAHTGDEVVVTAIARGGPADAAGLKLGETVTHVDGTDIRGISQADFCTIQDSKPQTITTESGKTYDAASIPGFFSGSE